MHRAWRRLQPRKRTALPQPRVSCEHSDVPLNEPRPPRGTTSSAAHGDGREQASPAATGHTLANELDPPACFFLLLFFFVELLDHCNFSRGFSFLLSTAVQLLASKQARRRAPTAAPTTAAIPTNSHRALPLLCSWGDPEQPPSDRK